MDSNQIASTNQFINIITGLSLFAVLFIALICLAVLILVIVAEVKLFKKMGKPGWAAIVPFYNTYVLVECAGLNWWWFLVAISGSILTIIFGNEVTTIAYLASAAGNFFIFYNLGKKFKQNPVTFGILGALLNGIIVMVLGLSSKYEYDASVPVSPNGPIDEKTASVAGNAEPEKFCLGCGKKLKSNAQFCENCGKKVE